MTEPEALGWLQTKVMAQKRALRDLNARLVRQRAVLRYLHEHGRELTEAEWAELRAARPDLDPALVD